LVRIYIGDGLVQRTNCHDVVGGCGFSNEIAGGYVRRWNQLGQQTLKRRFSRTVHTANKHDRLPHGMAC
jgi:hypothetical protein